MILAAGRGSRLGGEQPKALLSLGGQALIRATLANYLSSSIEHVVVVLGYGAAAVEAALPQDRRLSSLIHADWSLGLSTSIRVGLAALPEHSTHVLIGLGDMPWIPPGVLERLMECARREPDCIIAPSWGGRRGHPVLFPRRDWGELSLLEGDRGAACLLERHHQRLRLIEVEEPGILRDVDFMSDLPAPLPRVVVRGGGDLATGVAHRLSVSGFPVLILELAQPRMLRASVSFAQAVVQGECQVEGVRARRFNHPPADWLSALPVVVDPQGEHLREIRPEVLVDARMLKRAEGISLDLADLVVALGPGPVAGRDCHAVVETERGHRLGRVIWEGPAAPDTGIPGSLGGEGERRVVRAPCEGILTARLALGTQVEAGETLATVGDQPVPARISGQLRGLMQSGLHVRAGEKVGDVDPRRDIDLDTISDKARSIGGGVLEAILRWRWGAGRPPGRVS